MTQCLFSVRGRLVSAFAIITACLFAGISASSAVAGPLKFPATVDTTACTYPVLSQPFLGINDSNHYVLAPGQSVNSFDGTGWKLSGGAQVITTELADGSTGQVLDLPSGSKATSPVMCVDSGFTTARTMVRNVIGGEGVHFFVAYDGTKTWSKPKNAGQVHGSHKDWTISHTVNVHPSHDAGWQVARFSFVPGGKDSDFQIYNFWVDPRMK
jgi:hypothetical protein